MRVGQTAFPKGGCDSPYHLTCFSYHVTLTLLLSTDQKKCKSRDFPGGLVVKNLPSHAGEAGLIPGWGTKIPPVETQLRQRPQLEKSARATVTEPLWSKACALQQKARAAIFNGCNGSIA